MRNAIYTCILILLISTYGCGDRVAPQESFVTTLGSDTLVVELFRMQPEYVEAEILIRSPQTRYYRQSLMLDGQGDFVEYHSAGYDPNDISGTPVEEEHARLEGDSLIVTRYRDTTEQRASFVAAADVLPWMDMVHWPYEVATRQLVAEGDTLRARPMFTFRGPAEYIFRHTTPDSASIQHPYRGTMTAAIDAHGALQLYDATATTRKLIVRRGGALNIKALAAKYANKPIGALSGEGVTERRVQGADITITFGQPSRRGRELFGGIVPWNERWRTGANRATHFKTSNTLRFGELEVSPGEYTLFTIPTPEGGTLIINTETGQNGNNHKQELDLGRVAMTRRQGTESVELFTIEAADRNGKGILQLRWGEDIFEVPFEVLPEE